MALSFGLGGICAGGSTIGATGPRRFDEVLVERPFHQADDGPFDPDHRVAPVVLVLRVPEPVVVQPDAAGEADPAVDDENLAVGAVVQLLERVPLRLAELPDPDAGASQPLPPLLRDLVGAHRVDDELHLHAALRGGARTPAVNCSPTRPFVVDVGLEADASSRALHGRRASAGKI